LHALDKTKPSSSSFILSKRSYYHHEEHEEHEDLKYDSQAQADELHEVPTHKWSTCFEYPHRILPLHALHG
jgi:hypothetical protein